MRIITEYAYGWCGERRGQWRPTRRAAELDALRAGHAQRDRNSRRIFLNIPASIVTRRVEPPMEAANITHMAVKPRFRLVGEEFA